MFIIIIVTSFILSLRVLPGGREIFAEVIRVATPNNFYPCLLCLAAGIGLFHGQYLRYSTAGQLPVVSVFGYLSMCSITLLIL